MSEVMTSKKMNLNDDCILAEYDPSPDMVTVDAIVEEKEETNVEDDLNMEEAAEVPSDALAALAPDGTEQEDKSIQDQDTMKKDETKEEEEADGPTKLRTVNDYDEEDDLRQALLTRMDGTVVEIPSSFHEDQQNNSIQTINEEKICDFDDDDDFSQMEEELIKEELDPEFEWVVTNLDAETSVEQSLDEELRRLQVLKSYLILDAKPEASFDHLTALAGRIFDVPIALVSLVDLGRAWFMSNRGLGDVKQIPRRAFCAHAILSTQDMLIIPNTHEDIRFKDSAVVANPPHIGFYAGCPLVSPEGVKLGTFCLLDTKPRKDLMSSNLNDKANLRELSQLAMDLMVRRRKEQLLEQNDKTKMIACVAHDLLTPLSGVQMSLSLLKEDCDENDPNMKIPVDEQRDLIDTAHNCTEMMGRICHDTIETCRADMKTKQEALLVTNKANNSSKLSSSSASSKHRDDDSSSQAGSVDGRRPKLKNGHTIITLKDLIRHITLVMEPYPKKVPLYVTLDPALPAEFVSNDLKVFRSIINYLTNACKHTQVGCVHLRVLLKDAMMSPNESETNKKNNKKNKSKKNKQMIVFEVEDTGKGVPEEHYTMLFRPFRDDAIDDEAAKIENEMINCNKCLAGGCDTMDEDTPGLGLYSVATNIGSLGGSYGFRPRETVVDLLAVAADENELSCPLRTGSIFWFSLPFVEPPSFTTPKNNKPNALDLVECRYSTCSSATTSVAGNQMNHLQRRIIKTADGTTISSTGSSISIAQSITDSYKSRPVRGNVLVCEAVPRDAYYKRQNVIKNDEASSQKNMIVKKDNKTPTPSVSNGNDNDDGIVVKNYQTNNEVIKNSNTGTNNNKKVKKIMYKAKRLCGGRLNSSQSSVASLHNGSGKKISSNSMEKTFKVEKKKTYTKKIKSASSTSSSRMPPLDEDSMVVTTASPTSTASSTSKANMKGSSTTTNATTSSNSKSLSLTNIVDNHKKDTAANDGDDDSSIETNLSRPSQMSQPPCPGLIESHDMSSSRFSESSSSNKQNNSSNKNNNNSSGNNKFTDLLKLSNHGSGSATMMSRIKDKLLGLTSTRIDAPEDNYPVVDVSNKGEFQDFVITKKPTVTHGHVDRLLAIDDTTNSKFPAKTATVPVKKTITVTEAPKTLTKVSVTSSEACDKVVRQPKALVIDDSVVIRKTLNRALTTLGYDVTLATNGMEGLQKLQRTKFDVTFCDFLMPIMDGLDCVQQFRSWEADYNASVVDDDDVCYRQYIIGISAHANQRDVQRGIEVGMDDFMGKPVQLKSLKELIKSDKMIQIRHTLDNIISVERNKKNNRNDSTKQLLKQREGSQGSGKSIWNRDNDDSDTSTSVHRSSVAGSVEFTEHHDEVKQVGNSSSFTSNARKNSRSRQVKENDNDSGNNEGGKPTCLVAEDSTTIAKVLKSAIEGQGWDVDIACDGEIALQKLQQRNYDVVLMDDNMPKLNGTQCMEQFRKWETYNRISKQNMVVWMSGTYVPPPDGPTVSMCPPSYPTNLYDSAMSKPVLLKDLYKILHDVTSKTKSSNKEKSSSDIMVR